MTTRAYGFTPAETAARRVAQPIAAHYVIAKTDDPVRPWRLSVAPFQAMPVKLGTYKSKRKALTVAAFLAGRTAKITIINND